MTFTAGSLLCEYQILTQLGAGGMRVVYRAQDPRLDREVALKVIRRALVAESA